MFKLQTILKKYIDTNKNTDVSMIINWYLIVIGFLVNILENVMNVKRTNIAEINVLFVNSFTVVNVGYLL